MFQSCLSSLDVIYIIAIVSLSFICEIFLVSVYSFNEETFKDIFSYFFHAIIILICLFSSWKHWIFYHHFASSQIRYKSLKILAYFCKRKFHNLFGYVRTHEICLSCASEHALRRMKSGNAVMHFKLALRKQIILPCLKSSLVYTKTFLNCLDH